MNPLLTWLFHLHRRWLRLRGALTLGTRIIVIKNESVLLVSSTYTRGWHLPGGGVDHHESFQDGAHRELREECGLEANALELFGLYVNQLGRHVDHIAVFIAHGVTREPEIQDRREIKEIRYFPLAALPSDLLSGHRRRITEVLKSTSHSIRHSRW